MKSLYILKNMINLYKKEVLYLRVYLLISTIVIITSWSVYIFFDTKTICHFNEEDSFFEIMTPIYLFLSSLIFIVLFYNSKNFYFIILSFVLFLGAGEEISWGQHIFKYKTPEWEKEINIQGEFNIHNIELFNSLDFQHKQKRGINRLLEINFLFKLFTILWGIALPICVYYIKLIKSFALKMKIPIPSLIIGIFFLINYLILWNLNTFILSHDKAYGYLEATNEIFECNSAFIFLLIGIYFISNKKILRIGEDIKVIL